MAVKGKIEREKKLRRLNDRLRSKHEAIKKELEACYKEYSVLKSAKNMTEAEMMKARNAYFTKIDEINQRKQAMPNNSRLVRQKRRCSISGRSRAHLRFFGITRHELREKAAMAEIPGIIKYSW